MELMVNKPMVTSWCHSDGITWEEVVISNWPTLGRSKNMSVFSDACPICFKALTSSGKHQIWFDCILFNCLWVRSSMNFILSSPGSSHEFRWPHAWWLVMTRLVAIGDGDGGVGEVGRLLVTVVGVNGVIVAVGWWRLRWWRLETKGDGVVRRCGGDDDNDGVCGVAEGGGGVKRVAAAVAGSWPEKGDGAGKC
nr:hypothetical protein [Tanacetum cinerariifolium]